MTTYEGPATIVTEDGVEANVTVRVSVHLDDRSGLWSWHGRAVPDGTADLWSAFNARGAKLRLPDRSTGDIIIQKLTESAAELVGSGRPPEGVWASD